MSVCEKVREIFTAKLNVEPPEEQADLIAAGILDSFMFVELLLQLEQAFGLKFTLENLEIDNFRSIARITDFVGTSTQSQNLA